jgi:hypothetical protein
MRCDTYEKYKDFSMNEFVNKSGLCDKAKEVLLQDAREICEKLDLKSNCYGLKEAVALKLACDKNSCVLSIKPPVKYLSEGRRQTGIKQRIKPSEYIDAQIKLLSKTEYKEHPNFEVFKQTCYKLLKEEEKIPLGNPRSTAVTIIYIASILAGMRLTQTKLKQFFNISEPAIRKNFEKIISSLGENIAIETEILS